MTPKLYRPIEDAENRATIVARRRCSIPFPMASKSTSMNLESIATSSSVLQPIRGARLLQVTLFSPCISSLQASTNVGHPDIYVTDARAPGLTEDLATQGFRHQRRARPYNRV